MSEFWSQFGRKTSAKNMTARVSLPLFGILNFVAGVLVDFRDSYGFSLNKQLNECSPPASRRGGVCAASWEGEYVETMRRRDITK